MEGVNLKDALAIAARYANPKGADRNLNVVVLRDGLVRATDGISGCSVPCAKAVDIDLAVDCAALRRMVGAIGEGVKLAKTKGRKLSVKGAGVKYTLQAIPKASEPSFPDVPDDGWSAVSQDQMNALAQIALLVDPKASQLAFHGMRLTPHWCGAAASNTVGFAWIEGLVTEGFTAPPSVFADSTAAGELCIHERRLFVRFEKTSEVRWSLGLDGDWPEAGIQAALLDARGRDRSHALVKLADLGLLARQAIVVTDNKAQAFRMTLDSSGLVLEGNQGAADFRGTAAVEDYTPGSSPSPAVGVEPSRLALLCGVVEAAGGEGHYIALAGPLSPVMVWNHGAPVVVETLTMPMRLE